MIVAEIRTAQCSEWFGAEIIYAWMVLFLASLPLYAWVKSQNQSKVLNHVTES